MLFKETREFFSHLTCPLPSAEAQLLLLLWCESSARLLGRYVVEFPEEVEEMTRELV